MSDRRMVDDMPERDLFYEICQYFKSLGATVFAGSNFLDAKGHHINVHMHATGNGYLLAHNADYSKKMEVYSVGEAGDYAFPGSYRL